MAEYKGRKRGPKAFEFTEEVYQKIEELAGQGLNERDIAYCIGMHPTTFSEKKYKLEKLHYVGVEGKNYFVSEGWPEALVGSQTVPGTNLGGRSQPHASIRICC